MFVSPWLPTNLKNVTNETVASCCYSNAVDWELPSIIFICDICSNILNSQGNLEITKHVKRTRHVKKPFI